MYGAPELTLTDTNYIQLDSESASGGTNIVHFNNNRNLNNPFVLNYGFSGNFSLINETGASALTASSADVLSGTTEIAGGQLILRNSKALGSSLVKVNKRADGGISELVLDSQDGELFENSTTGDGDVRVTGNVSVYNPGAASFTGKWIVTGTLTLQTEGAGTLGGSEIEVPEGGTVYLNNPDAAFNQKLTGKGRLIIKSGKTHSGTQLPTNPTFELGKNSTDGFKGTIELIGDESNPVVYNLGTGTQGRFSNSQLEIGSAANLVIGEASGKGQYALNSLHLSGGTLNFIEANPGSGTSLNVLEVTNSFIAKGNGQIAVNKGGEFWNKKLSKDECEELKKVPLLHKTTRISLRKKILNMGRIY